MSRSCSSFPPTRLEVPSGSLRLTLLAAVYKSIRINFHQPNTQPTNTEASAQAFRKTHGIPVARLLIPSQQYHCRGSPAPEIEQLLCVSARRARVVPVSLCKLSTLKGLARSSTPTRYITSTTTTTSSPDSLYIRSLLVLYTYVVFVSFGSNAVANPIADEAGQRVRVYIDLLNIVYQYIRICH
jgi:hypothetical protein